MAGRFVNPYPQFADATPDVYAGGRLCFYATGTSTPLDTYTTKALAVANPNPIVLNSAGRPAVDIFLQDLEYKVVLKDANDNEIWTADPVSHRDSLLVAKTITGSGSPNGSVAGTAGSSSVLPDFYWDYTNSILYVCTTTGTSSTAVWTAINASSATPAVPPPQGRLTLTSATPVLSADTTSSAVYYTPYTGNLIPIYSGSAMIPTSFSELSLSLVASHVASTIYDIFVFSNAGVLTLVTGPAWTTSTAGAGARGTGGSTTQLARVQGIWTNAVSMSARNGSSTYTVGANLGTYVGSIFIDAGGAATTCHVAYGQSRKYGLWNAYNRVPIIVKAGDTTAGWTIGGGGGGAYRALNNGTSNSITIFSGMPEMAYDCTSYLRVTYTATTSQALQFFTAIGFNSTSAASGLVGTGAVNNGAGVSGNFTNTNSAIGKLATTPNLIGINVITHLEAYTVTGAAAPSAVAGGEASNMLTASWMA